MLTLVGLHHKQVMLAAFRLLGRRLVSLPPCRGKLAFRQERLANGLLCLCVSIGELVALQTVSDARLLVDGVDDSAS